MHFSLTNNSNKYYVEGQDDSICIKSSIDNDSKIVFVPTTTNLAHPSQDPFLSIPSFGEAYIQY